MRKTPVTDFVLYIAPHEHFEVAKEYADVLTQGQIDYLLDSTETLWLVCRKGKYLIVEWAPELDQ